MKKENLINLAIGGAVLFGTIYLVSRAWKLGQKEKSKNLPSEEEMSNASGVQKGQRGWVVKCADGGTSMPYNTQSEASANVDSHCANRGGGGIVMPVGSFGVRLSAVR